MQTDFHYCCIKVVAMGAGYLEEEAEILAYASQYVDDATAHKPIKVSGVPACAKPLMKKGWFDPTCTAHSGIQYLTAMNRDVQRKVYIPFHFVPGKSHVVGEPYDYRVQPNGEIARTLLAEGLKLSSTEKLKGLIKTGIALHTLADTWSHQRFSGRHCAADNDIERIRLQMNGKWESLPFFEQLGANILPDIGHAEALTFPDWSHLTWAYEHDATGIRYTRDNTEIFLDAASNIHETLLPHAPEAGVPWKSLVGRIKVSLGMPTDSGKAKFARWKEQFPEAKLHYDSSAWKREALTGGPLNWEHYQTEKDFATLNLRALGDEKWFHFHVEANAQRNRVLGIIQRDLL